MESGEGQDQTFILSEVKSLDDAVPTRARSTRIEISPASLSGATIEAIFELLSSNPGSCEVYFDLNVDGVNVNIHSVPIKIAGSRALQQKLEDRGCAVEWIL
jgi:hypothetical protein